MAPTLVEDLELEPPDESGEVELSEELEPAGGVNAIARLVRNPSECYLSIARRSR